MIEHKYDRVPWTTEQTYIGILITLVPWLVFSLLISRESGSIPAQALPFQKDLSGAILTFVLSTLVEATFLIAPFYFARRALSVTEQGRQHWGAIFQSLGFRSYPLWRSLGLIASFFVLIFVVNLAYVQIAAWVHQIFPTINIQPNDARICAQSHYAPLSTTATLIVAVLVAPLCEEVFFRSFVFMGLLRGLSPTWAIVLSSLIFAIAHADASSFLVLFVIGMALAYLRWYTNSIWPSIALHTLNNGSSALLIFLAMQGSRGC